MSGLPRLLRLGDHACQFFATAEDLGEVLIPFFKEGLERDEACIWVTGGPYGKDRAMSEMRSAADSFDARHAAGQMEIHAHDEWYLTDGRLSTRDLVATWLRKKDDALAAGYTGLRLTGNVSFLDASDWPQFMAYEHAVTEAFRGQPVAALCSYCLSQCDADKTLDILDSHAFALRKKCGHWDVFGLRDHQAHLTRHVQGLEFRDLVEDRLSVHLRSKSHHITIEGAKVLLSAKKARDLGLLLQELVSNATKHGALSVPEGHLSVEWQVRTNGSRRLYVEWAERGVGKPLTLDLPGFGTRLIAETVENCMRVFEPGAMVCTFELALD